MKTTGMILILIGLCLTLFTAVNFFTKEKVVDLGKIEVTREKPNYISWSPALGIVVLAIGGVVLWQASKK